MSQSLSSLLVHVIFSTKDRCPFLGKNDLLQPIHAYLGGILRRVQCPAITIGGTADHVHAFFQLARTQNVAKKISFQEELREILRKYEVAFDERYLWD
jgi:REP element-mobilizing transposase RayT